MPSARDLAKMLGLSPATVSMVFNNRPGVSEETRALVLRTAEEIGYCPKAKSESSASRQLTLLIFSQSGESAASQNPYFMPLIEGVCLRAQQLGYTLQITYLKEDEQTLPSLPPDTSGIILLPSTSREPAPEFFDQVHIPIVMLDRSYYHRPIDTVSINNTQGAFIAAEHLISLGHTRLAFFGSRSNTNKSDRLSGYRQAVLSRSQTAASADQIFFSEPPGDYRVLAEQLRHLTEIPTGFICANDWYAANCIRAVIALGLRVPEDVSVVGFDNIPFGNYLTPPLTTIHVPKAEMGKLAVERLHQILTESETRPAMRIEVYTSLIQRKSTAPPKKEILTLPEK